MAQASKQVEVKTAGSQSWGKGVTLADIPTPFQTLALFPLPQSIQAPLLLPNLLGLPSDRAQGCQSQNLNTIPSHLLINSTCRMKPGDLLSFIPSCANRGQSCRPHRVLETFTWNGLCKNPGIYQFLDKIYFPSFSFPMRQMYCEQKVTRKQI